MEHLIIDRHVFPPTAPNFPDTSLYISYFHKIRSFQRECLRTPQNPWHISHIPHMGTQHRIPAEPDMHAPCWSAAPDLEKAWDSDAASRPTRLWCVPGSMTLALCLGTWSHQTQLWVQASSHPAQNTVRLGHGGPLWEHSWSHGAMTKAAFSSEVQGGSGSPPYVALWLSLPQQESST